MRPPPITGGTLLVTHDDLGVASDPDRDTAFIVDLEARSLTHTVALDAGARPGRIAEGAPGRVHVLLTGAGAVASIDTESGEVLSRTPACSEPRGVPHDPGAALVYVACVSGQLVVLDEASGEVLEREFLRPDLRDVVVVDGEPIVSMSETEDATFKTPSLRRVSLRPPYMHDGRALTLEDAVSDMIDRTAAADDSDGASAIAAFLRTL